MKRKWDALYSLMNPRIVFLDNGIGFVSASLHAVPGHEFSLVLFVLYHLLGIFDMSLAFIILLQRRFIVLFSLHGREES